MAKEVKEIPGQREWLAKPKHERAAHIKCTIAAYPDGHREKVAYQHKLDTGDY